MSRSAPYRNSRRDTDAPRCKTVPLFVYACTACRAAASNAAPTRRAATSNRPTSPGVRASRPAAASPRVSARGEPRRAARLYPQPGRRSARHQPLDPAPAAPVHRDDRAALGHQPDPGRRARADRGRAATHGTAATRAGDARTQAGGSLRRSRSASTDERSAGKSLRQIAEALTPTGSRQRTAARVVAVDRTASSPEAHDRLVQQPSSTRPRGLAAPAGEGAAASEQAAIAAAERTGPGDGAAGESGA